MYQSPTLALKADARIRCLFLMGSWVGGGAERVTAKLMERVDTTRFDVRLGLLRASGPYLDSIDPARVIVAPQSEDHFRFEGENRALFKPATLTKAAFHGPAAFRHIIGQVQPDVVMSFFKGTALLTWLAMRGMSPKPRWIIREGNNVLAVADRESPNALIKSLSLRLTRHVYRKADAILTNSSDMACGLVGDLRLGATQVRMINNPIDLEAIATAVAQPVHELPERPFIVNVGRLAYQKGQDTLLSAYASSGLWRTHDLVLLGEGPCLGELRALAATLGVARHVRFTGFVANPYAWMARAQLMVQPSRWEGFPTALAEGLACGVPVIHADCSYGPRDIVEPGISGEIVPVDDAATLARVMAGMIADPEHRARLVAAGKARVQRFAVDAMVAHYETLFEEFGAQRAAARLGLGRTEWPITAGLLREGKLPT
ncbi:MAG: glycosyltransferase [Novosphingobium sp.]